MRHPTRSDATATQPGVEEEKGKGDEIGGKLLPADAVPRRWGDGGCGVTKVEQAAVVVVVVVDVAIHLLFQLPYASHRERATDHVVRFRSIAGSLNSSPHREISLA